MKYRHSFHAGNFADVHKHVTLLALLTALKKKDKGLLYLDTHAGRGSYDLSSPSPASGASRAWSTARRSCASTRRCWRSFAPATGSGICIRVRR